MSVNFIRSLVHRGCSQHTPVGTNSTSGCVRGLGTLQVPTDLPPGQEPWTAMPTGLENPGLILGTVLDPGMGRGQRALLRPCLDLWHLCGVPELQKQGVQPNEGSPHLLVSLRASPMGLTVTPMWVGTRESCLLPYRTQPEMGETCLWLPRLPP